MRGETIREIDAYAGVRIDFKGYLGTARLDMQIDVGFSDRLVVEPPVVTLDTRLPDFPPPQVKVYPPEAIIAEKVEAFVQLGLLTGRVKDFYDIWFITEAQPVDGSTLCAALRQTFTQRGTTLPASLDGVLDGFPTDRHRRAWAAMARKAQRGAAIPPLEETVDRLRALLDAPLAALAAGEVYPSVWQPGAGWGG